MAIGVVAAGPVIASLVGTSAIPTAAVGGPLLGGLVKSVAPSLIGQGLLSSKPPAVKLKPGDILRAALQISALEERGLEPFAGTDPLSGNLVVGSRDQDLGTLVAERNLRDQSTLSAADVAPIEEARTFLINSRAGTVTADVDGLQAVVPARRSTPSARIAAGARTTGQFRLSGPCAGARTGIARLRCGRGGFA